MEAQTGQCRGKNYRCRGASRRDIRSESGAGNKAGRAGSGPGQDRPSFHLGTPLHVKATSFRQTYREYRADPAVRARILFARAGQRIAVARVP